MPPGTAAPLAGTILAVYSGTGRFVAKTTVLASPAPTATSFTVSATPAEDIISASLCGGTCAFFNAPSTSSSVTNFTVTKTTGTGQWSGGFICRSGVDQSKIQPVTATTTKPTRWQETVQ